MDDIADIGGLESGPGKHRSVSGEALGSLFQYLTMCSQGVDPTKAFGALSQGLESDPRIHSLLSLLSPPERDGTMVPGSLDKKLGHGVDNESGSVRAPPRERRRLRTVRRLLAEVEASREILATLAAGLGACTCFGNPVCPLCLGRGRPGHYAPDAELFDSLVEPAVVRRNGHRSGGSETSE